MSKIPFVKHPEEYPNPMFPEWEEADKVLWEVVTEHTKVCVLKKECTGGFGVALIDLPGLMLIPNSEEPRFIDIYNRFSSAIFNMINIDEISGKYQGELASEQVLTEVEVEIKKRLTELYMMVGISYRRLFWWMLSGGSVLHE